MVHGDRTYLEEKYEDLQHLHKLDVSYSKITSLNANIFNGLNNLRELYLHYNQLTSLDSLIFDGLINLNELWLHYNRLASLNVNVFKALINLKELKLSYNELSILDSKIFNDLKNIDILWLHHNQMTSLDANLFAGLSNLTQLMLNNNQFTSLDSKIFNDLINLTQLKLSFNQLTKLDSNAFNGLKNLKELWLNNNQLTSLDANIFNGLSKIDKLYLHENKLSHLNQDTFSHLTQINVISLYENEVEFISFISTDIDFDWSLDRNKSFLSNFATFLVQFNEESISQKISSPIIGQIFENYKVGKCLGFGTSGYVYSCLNLTDNSTNDLIFIKEKAIKILRNPDGKYLEDVNSLKKLNSEFIIKYYAQFTKEFDFCIVFEYAENEDLSKLIEKYKPTGHDINPSRIFEWTIQATQGLQMLHSNRIIHRDIKPENIFRFKNDNIKLGDLGTAKNLEDYEENSGKFSSVGSFLYMSPEVLKNESYSFNTDIWSLGCVVYELLFLKPVFLGFGIERNVECLDQDSILTGLIKKMLTLDRRRRPTSDELYPILMIKSSGNFLQFYR